MDKWIDLVKRELGADILKEKYAYGLDEQYGYMSQDKIPDRWVKTTCGYCSVGCGMLIGVKDNKAVSVRGDEHHPVNEGKLCPKGLSEHYAIRIRQDYAKLLPQEFLHDPKAFFAGHGELMKGSKGEGEYPDEEVTLFRLTDGTEIVAKRIELRKAKEARKEFAILIAAKKAGLPTAEPVGFLSGKEDADGSYLLMKKLEGRSGRKFEKELREAGKYSDEQIKDIMKQVAEKNREMAELFRTTLKIDKRWRIKDTIIEFNEETGEVESVVPIDWERAQNYNPSTPKEIDEIA